MVEVSIDELLSEASHIPPKSEVNGESSSSVFSLDTISSIWKKLILKNKLTN